MNQKEIQRKTKIKKWFKELINTLSCSNCNENQSVCLDFHHVKPKFKQVNQLVRDGYSKTRIINEIDKCIVLCGNCHRIKHNEISEKNINSTRKTQSRRKWVIELKELVGCYNCNIKGYTRIDFHHIQKKKYGINYMVSRFSKTRILTERKKCIPLCVNCHRKIHNQIIEFKISDTQLADYWNQINESLD